MAASLNLDGVREAAARVAALSRSVRVGADRLPAYAASLPLDGPPAQLDPEVHFFGEEEETALFVVALDSVNFGSGWFPELRRRDERSGYFHVARALKERFESGGPPSARELAELTPEGCSAIFGQPTRGAIFELMTLFATALNELGRFLEERCRGSVRVLIDSAERSAQRLAGELALMPFFQDVHLYRGMRVPILKRAQITPSDLALALGGHGLGEFHDLEKLTIFADNLVPHVLRLDGVLEFDPELVARIERGELLVSGSEEEVEVRACAIHAVELLKGELSALGREARSLDLDILLWNRGQGAAYKARPRPRCRCVYY